MHGGEGHANKWSIPLKRLSFAPLGLVLGLALPMLAAAEATNFLTVAKIGCTPDKVTRCSSDDKCESRDASAKDKAEVLVIDFAAKKASVPWSSGVAHTAIVPLTALGTTRAPGTKALTSG